MHEYPEINEHVEKSEMIKLCGISIFPFDLFPSSANPLVYMLASVCGPVPSLSQQSQQLKIEGRTLPEGAGAMTTSDIFLEGTS